MNRLTELELEAEHFAHLQARAGACLRVATGTLWLTIDGEPDDRLLERGQSAALPPGTHVLVQALGAPARAQLDAPPHGWQRIAEAWRAARAQAWS
jgi:hypothetical protein